MNKKKRTAMVASFTVGAMLFATTAFADITSKSGYEQLKDSVKVTADKTSTEFDSITLDTTYLIKDNGKVMESDNQVTKYDRKKNATETISTGKGMNGKDYNRYTYSDTKTFIHNNGGNNKYFVTQYPEGRDHQGFDNPFEEDEAKDIERILDAIVGNLKDHVVAEDNPDGSTELSGSLSEMQIPTLINAVSSFQMKQMSNGYGNNNQWPRLSKDIYVKEITGSASVDKDGVLEDILGTATITGKDTQGQVHNITVEILAKVKDINATTVKKPDLNGKEVVKEVARAYSNDGLSNPQKFEGTFKNDIVVEKDGKFVKAGERILKLTKVDKNGVTGSYQEEVRPGFEDMINHNDAFNFNATFENEKNNRDARFEVTDNNGNNTEGSIYFDEHAGKVNFHLNQPYNGGAMFDSTFSPVLE